MNWMKGSYDKDIAWMERHGVEPGGSAQSRDIIEQHVAEEHETANPTTLSDELHVQVFHFYN